MLNVILCLSVADYILNERAPDLQHPSNPNILPDNGMKKIVFGEIKVVAPGKTEVETGI